MPPLSVLMEMAFLLQISASPIEVNFNADMNEKPENIYSIYYPTITTRWVISIIFTHSEWVILNKTTHSEWAFLEKRLLFTFYLASTEPHFLRLLRSEGVIDSLSLITYLPCELPRVRWMVTMLWLIWCKEAVRADALNCAALQKFWQVLFIPSSLQSFQVETSFGRLVIF